MNSWRIFVFFLCLALPVLVHARFVFVGNGGEGVLLQDKIVTRDLYDYDLHESPYFGNTASSELLESVSSWSALSLTAEQKLLLAKKLTDLEGFQAGLGQALFKAMQFFDWKYVSDNLVLINPDGGIKKVPFDLRVPLANRYMSTIVVDRRSFARLNDENKVALILHEVVYSLLPVRVKQWNKREQDLSMAKHLTAGFFSLGSLQSDSFRQTVVEQLGFLIFMDSQTPGTALLPTTQVSKRILRMETVDSDRNIVQDLRGDQTAASLSSAIVKFCARVTEKGRTEDRIQLSRSPWIGVDNYIYTNLNGTAQYKLHFIFEQSMQAPYSVLSAENCEVLTQQNIQKLLSSEPQDFQRGLFSFGKYIFHGMSDFYCQYKNPKHVSRVWGPFWSEEVRVVATLPSEMVYAGYCGPYQGVHNFDGELAYTYERGYSCWLKDNESAYDKAGVLFPEKIPRKSVRGLPVSVSFVPNEYNVCY